MNSRVSGTRTGSRDLRHDGIGTRKRWLMQGRLRTILKSGRGGRLWRVLTAVLILTNTFPASRPCLASHIRTHRPHATAIHSEATLGPTWIRFLNGGQALWAVVKPPPIPSHLVLARQNGFLVETPFVDYLYWRRSLNPARFDLFHRTLGPALGQLTPPSATGVSATGITPQASTPPTTNAVPQNGVPEPSGLAIGLMLVGVALVLRHRHLNKG